MRFLKLKAMLEIFLVLSLVFAVSFSFNSSQVFAQEDEQVCCGEAEVDGSTQYCTYTSRSNCVGSDILEGSCDSASFCRPVCCNVNGLGYEASDGEGCFSSVAYDVCVNDLGGVPMPGNAQCTGIPECQKACCVVGNQCTLTTQDSCNDITSSYTELEVDYRLDITSEGSCQDVCRAQTRGCCVSQSTTVLENNCNMITQDDCLASGGEFFPGVNCIDLPAGDNRCNQCKVRQPDARLGCATDLDQEDVFWFDNCGNAVDVAENGDCSYFDGTLCREANGTASCADLNCAGDSLWDNPHADENKNCCLGVYENGICNDGYKDIDNSCWTDDTIFGDEERDFRYNGESWCEYDAAAGPTIDLPGNRHYKHSCLEGREVAEPCGDFRDLICRQSEFVSDDTGVAFSSAACLENRAVDCLDCADQQCCENTQERDCVWIGDDTPTTEEIQQRQAELQSDIDECNPDSEDCPDSPGGGGNVSYTVEESGFCVPLVPLGTEFWEEEVANEDCNRLSSSNAEDALIQNANSFWSGTWEFDCDE